MAMYVDRCAVIMCTFFSGLYLELYWVSVEHGKWCFVNGVVSLVEWPSSQNVCAVLWMRIYLSLKLSAKLAVLLLHVI